MTHSKTTARLALTVGIVVAWQGDGWAQRNPRSRPPQMTTRPACIPGAQVACACSRGRTGIQVCNDTGQSFTPCDCTDTIESGTSNQSSSSNAQSESSARAVQPTLNLAPQPTARRWYGYQVLLSDVASLTIGAIAVSEESVPAGIVSGVGWTFGAPIIHWAHGRTGAGFLSLALRILLPLVGTTLAVAGSAEGAELSVAAGVSGIVGAVVDIAANSREQ